MRSYLEVDLPQPLSTHLFLAFSQKSRQETPDHLKEEASSSEPNGPGTWASFAQGGRVWGSSNSAMGEAASPEGAPEHSEFPVG